MLTGPFSLLEWTTEDEKVTCKKCLGALDADNA
jgi:hypothetical protein